MVGFLVRATNFQLTLNPICIMLPNDFTINNGLPFNQAMEEKIAIKISRSETVFHFPSSISHIEANDKYTRVFIYENLKVRMIASSYSLKKMQEITRKFTVKVRRSVLVNPLYCQSYNSMHGELLLLTRQEPIIIPNRFKVWMSRIFGND